MKRLVNSGDTTPAGDDGDRIREGGKYDGFVHYELDPSRNYPKLIDDPGLKADKKVFQASVSDVLRNCSWKSKQDAGDFRMRACILFGLPTELADAPTDVLIDEIEDASKATDNLKADAPMMEREIKIHKFGEKDQIEDGSSVETGNEVIASPFDSLFGDGKKRKVSSDEGLVPEVDGYNSSEADTDGEEDHIEEDDDNGDLDG